MDNCNYATMKLIEMHLNDVEESLDVDDNRRDESSGANMTSGDTDTRHIAGSVYKKENILVTTLCLLASRVTYDIRNIKIK